MIELLVVIVIIGILLSIATMSGKQWLDKSRVESQMKELYVELMNARVKAMQTNRTYFVSLLPAQYTVYEDTTPAPDGDGDLQTATDKKLIEKNLNPAYGLTIPANIHRVNFDSRGLASTFPEIMGIERTIRVTGSFGSAYDCIVVSITRIRIGAWKGGDCVVQ